ALEQAMAQGLAEPDAPLPSIARLRWSVPALAAAAALLLLVLRWLAGGAQEAERGELWLRDVPASATASPVGAVSDFDRFEWSFDGTPGAVFQVVVWNGAQADGAPVLTGPEVERPPWEPSAEQRALFGDTIRWAVVEIDPIHGERRTRIEVLATRED
ncbi:MAG: hypothetical protein AAFZ65_15825, partial [Planctomycetota bacterium]